MHMKFYTIMVLAKTIGQDDRGMAVSFPAEAKMYLLVTKSRPALGPTQPHVTWMGLGGTVFSWLKWAKLHAPPLNSQVNNA
jgi:hypothetical protein